MRSNDTLVVLYNETEFPSDLYQLAFPATAQEMYELLVKLRNIKTKTGQTMDEFAYVFPKGSLYPADYKAFWDERKNPQRKRFNTQADFFLQRPIRGGKVKQKLYAFAEDFDWQFDKWTGQDVIILDMNEALKGDYVYERDILKRWGDKDPLISADLTYCAQ
ncbi:hypothetical protein GZH47_33500 (plasmid) [Paenibacillus rhizovicinus]|uniref:Uncharacterized protein n=1 Tax=Paenibacillus rhizovicinus TaxID=2704463 RepID=A0A6C0PB49_9BACL|nr:hypothetical protein [Paenibacillus rhizovicinus]QHW35810.1 hypothetical protein GZH47_33500 [Paenibacillus rhizovicinus]